MENIMRPAHMKKTDVLEAIRTMLLWIGEDPDREGLAGTPERVIRSWEKIYGGYLPDSTANMSTSFSTENYNQMIVLGPVEFWSTCEHHMMPFYGSVHVGYLPGVEGRVLGISKLARVVELYARRLQIQERMTQQIAEAIEKGANARGVGVVVRGKHLCMVARGIEKQKSWMTTSALVGSFLDEQKTKEEFLSLIKGQWGDQ